MDDKERIEISEEVEVTKEAFDELTNGKEADDNVE